MHNFDVVGFQPEGPSEGGYGVGDTAILDKEVGQGVEGSQGFLFLVQLFIAIDETLTRGDVPGLGLDQLFKDGDGLIVPAFLVKVIGLLKELYPLSARDRHRKPTSL
jgi:hypothetical protein